MSPHVPSRSRRASLRVSAALLAVACVWLAATPADSQDPSEYRLKAAFVKTFPRFVSWPPSALQGRRTFDICIASPDPFGSSLRELVEGETIDGRPLTVRVITDAVTDCHVLFVSTTTPNATTWLRMVARAPVLTVTDAESLAPATAIRLRVVANKVRFDVNLGAAAAAGLRLNAQLVRLALNVTGGGQ